MVKLPSFFCIFDLLVIDTELPTFDNKIIYILYCNYTLSESVCEFVSDENDLIISIVNNTAHRLKLKVMALTLEVEDKLNFLKKRMLKSPIMLFYRHARCYQ